MTVKELIELLRKHDPKAEVQIQYVECLDGETHVDTTVPEIEVRDNKVILYA